MHRIVREHLETHLALAAEADPLGDGVPTYVENEFRSYLKCVMTSASLRRASGIPLSIPSEHLGRRVLAHGFARAWCSGCGREFLVGFSFKPRGSCPSCGARHMAEAAAHMLDHVFPHVPVRQIVLSVPKRLRPFLHHRPKAATAPFSRTIHTIAITLFTQTEAPLKEDRPSYEVPGRKEVSSKRRDRKGFSPSAL